jgi:hypothetical protein
MRRGQQAHGRLDDGGGTGDVEERRLGFSHDLVMLCLYTHLTLPTILLV